MLKKQLNSLIGDRKAIIGVIGLGYAGLPLLVAFASRGFKTIGFDTDDSRTAEINNGTSYLEAVKTETISQLTALGQIYAASTFERLSECDAIFICVPTPLSKTKEPDISYILKAAENIRANLRRGQLIVLESTTYPGTTEEVLLPMLEETGLKIELDFLLAFSPERIDPGNPIFTTSNIPKIVGGVSPDSTIVAAYLYSQIVTDVHTVSSAQVAEATKLLENTYRAVNIGLANELSHLCYVLRVDTWEVIRAAATKPFGFMAFYPGPGIGGHCIPLDPHYLSWKARQHGFDSRFIGLAEEVNSTMPGHVVNLIADGLNEQKKTLKGSHILILGVTYKRDVADVRESPASTIINTLLSKGAEVSYHDPFKKEFNVIGFNGEIVARLSSVPLTDENLSKPDCVVVVTDHSAIDYQRVAQLASLIVDTRNALDSSASKATRVIKL